MITDTPEFRGCQRRLGDAGVAVHGDDQVGGRRDLRGLDPLWIGLHDDLDPDAHPAAARRSSPSWTTTRTISTPCWRKVLNVVTPKWREPTRVIRMCVRPS